jgi:hypothetical protein
MAEENLDDTLENTGKETPGEDNSQKDPKDGSLEETNKRLFARTKAAEDKAKKYEASLKMMETELNNLKEGNLKPQEQKVQEKDIFDPVDIASLANTLKDLDPTAIALAKDISKSRNIPLKEAIKSSEVITYNEAMKEKIKNDNLTPDPTNKQPPKEQTPEESVLSGDVKEKSLAEQEKIFKALDEKYLGR